MVGNSVHHSRQPHDAHCMKSLLTTLLVALATAARAAGPDPEGFVPLFNGRDLSGWINVNCAPETWSVSNGVIHCTGHPTGALRLPRQYENFILELDWRHLSSGGNSGIFIWATPIAAPGVPFLRAIEVQVLDHGFNAPGKNQWYTTHGDVFPIHGSTMQPFGRHNGDRSFPSEERSKGSPEWNHYRIQCTNGVIRLSVNGQEVSGGEQCNYRKGYLGLEAEGAPVEFRNIRIRELPASGATPEMTAPLDARWRNLFTGLDLRGWRTNEATAARWTANGGTLRLAEAAGGARAATLWTASVYSDAEFVIDVRRPANPSGGATPPPALLIRGRDGEGFEIPLGGGEPGRWHRFTVAVHQGKVTLVRDAQDSQTFPVPVGTHARGALGLKDTSLATEFMNLYVRPL
jgi:hypothetical protein